LSGERLRPLPCVVTGTVNLRAAFRIVAVTRRLKAESLEDVLPISDFGFFMFAN
jgi:hypothetical protein